MLKHLSIAQTPIQHQDILRQLLHNPKINLEQKLDTLSRKFISDYLYRKPRNVSENRSPLDDTKASLPIQRSRRGKPQDATEETQHLDSLAEQTLSSISSAFKCIFDLVIDTRGYQFDKATVWNKCLSMIPQIEKDGESIPALYLGISGYRLNDTDVNDTTVLRDIIKQFNLSDLYKLLETRTSALNQTLDTGELKNPHNGKKLKCDIATIICLTKYQDGQITFVNDEAKQFFNHIKYNETSLTKLLSETKINKNETLLEHLISNSLTPPTPFEVITTPSSNFGDAIVDVLTKLKNDPEKYQQVETQSLESLKQEEVTLLFDVMEQTTIDELIETIDPYLRNESRIEIKEEMTPELIKDALKSKDLDIKLDTLKDVEKQTVLTLLYPDSMSDPEKTNTLLNTTLKTLLNDLLESEESKKIHQLACHLKNDNIQILNTFRFFLIPIDTFTDYSNLYNNLTLFKKLITSNPNIRQLLSHPMFRIFISYLTQCAEKALWSLELKSGSELSQQRAARLSDHYAAPCQHCQLLYKTFTLFNQIQPGTDTPHKGLQKQTPHKSNDKAKEKTKEEQPDWDFSDYFVNPETSFDQEEKNFDQAETSPAAPGTNLDALLPDKAKRTLEF